MPCTPLHVSFRIIQNDHLFRVRLDLIRSCLPNDTPEWTIKFAVSNRSNAADPFELVSETTLPVPPEDQAGAEVIAEGDLCDAQHAQAMAAASVAMEVRSGLATADDLNEQVLEILRVE